jgi:hypothetical protein
MPRGSRLAQPLVDRRHGTIEADETRAWTPRSAERRERQDLDHLTTLDGDPIDGVDAAHHAPWQIDREHVIADVVEHLRS